VLVILLLRAGITLSSVRKCGGKVTSRPKQSSDEIRRSRLGSRWGNKFRGLIAPLLVLLCVASVAHAKAQANQMAQANQSAQTELQQGLKYYRGTGVSKDYGQAAVHLRAAASKGNPEAAFWLGVMYEKGYGVLVDNQQALGWYRKAADAGNTTAMNNTGFIYEHGKGVPIDYAQAMTWYRKAADAGSSQAMDNMGGLYLNGLGVPRDAAQAMTWYRKAADIGNASAMIDVGMLYQNGIGVPKDYPQAEEWYRKALPTGGDSAQHHLDELVQLERAPVPPPPPPSDAVASSHSNRPSKSGTEDAKSTNEGAKSRVLRRADIASMLESGLDPKRVAVLVQQRGVNFSVTPATDKDLRAAGADDALLLAIATNKKN
jgi:TPR repeat protein